MKKAFAILLVISMLFAFAACGGSGDEASEGEKTLLGEWHLYDEGQTSPKETITFNEDGTGARVVMSDGVKRKSEFTYAEKSGALELTFENSNVSSVSYTLEVNSLTLNNNVYVRPLTVEGE